MLNCVAKSKAIRRHKDVDDIETANNDVERPSQSHSCKLLHPTRHVPSGFDESDRSASNDELQQNDHVNDWSRIFETPASDSSHLRALRAPCAHARAAAKPMPKRSPLLSVSQCRSPSVDSKEKFKDPPDNFSSSVSLQGTEQSFHNSDSDHNSVHGARCYFKWERCDVEATRDTKECVAKSCANPGGLGIEGLHGIQSIGPRRFYEPADAGVCYREPSKHLRKSHYVLEKGCPDGGGLGTNVSCRLLRGAGTNMPHDSMPCEADRSCETRHKRHQGFSADISEAYCTCGPGIPLPRSLRLDAGVGARSSVCVSVQHGPYDNCTLWIGFWWEASYTEHAQWTDHWRHVWCHSCTIDPARHCNEPELREQPDGHPQRNIKHPESTGGYETRAPEVHCPSFDHDDATYCFKVTTNAFWMRPCIAIWAVGGCKHSECVSNISRHDCDMHDSFCHTDLDRYIIDTDDRLSGRELPFMQMHCKPDALVRVSKFCLYDRHMIWIISLERVLRIDNANRIDNLHLYTSDPDTQERATWHLYSLGRRGRSRDLVLKLPYCRARPPVYRVGVLQLLPLRLLQLDLTPGWCW